MGGVTWAQYLTLSTLRLNSRDYLRDRSVASWPNPDNVSSLRIEPLSNAYGTISGPAGVTVTVHYPNKSDIDPNPTLEVTKPVRSFRSRRLDRYLLYL